MKLSQTPKSVSTLTKTPASFSTIASPFITCPAHWHFHRNKTNTLKLTNLSRLTFCSSRKLTSYTKVSSELPLKMDSTMILLWEEGVVLRKSLKLNDFKCFLFSIWYTIAKRCFHFIFLANFFKNISKITLAKIYQCLNILNKENNHPIIYSISCTF